MRRAVRNRYSHAIEQASRRTRRELLISTQVSLESERPFLEGATLCASLSSAVYANANAREALRSLQRAHVASGRTHDVAWSIVDGVRDGKLERHVVLRGFDASDDTGELPASPGGLRVDGVGVGATV